MKTILSFALLLVLSVTVRAAEGPALQGLRAAAVSSQAGARASAPKAAAAAEAEAFAEAPQGRHFDGDMFLEGAEGLLGGAISTGWGFLALCHPIGALAVGSLFLFCGVGSVYHAIDSGAKEHFISGAAFLGLGALTIAAPPLGAAGIFAVCAGMAALGLGLMVASFFQK